MNPRATVRDGGLARDARDGDGLIAYLDPRTVSEDSAQTLTWERLAGGLVLRTGMTANRIDTTDTALNILAANPQMDIGESFTVLISNQTAFTSTLAGGTGVTASGNLVVAANGLKHAMFTKTSLTTMSLIGL